MVKLSKRLNAIYDLIPSQSILCDIGTDHGWLIIKAVLDGKVKQAYGLDIAQGPLEHAQKNVETQGLSAQISLMQMDGLRDFNQPCDVFVIAGMGAETIWSILEARSFQRDQVLIVQSNTKQPWLRKQLIEHGFRIVHEVFLIENKKAVTIMVVKRGQMTLSDLDVYVGPVLKFSNKYSPYVQYLESRLDYLSSITHLNDALLDEVSTYRHYLETEVTL